MLDMRKILVLGLLVTFLPCCGGSEANSSAVEIPVPTSRSAVEPTVARLLNKTGNEVFLAIEDPQKWMAHGSALYANAYYNEASTAFGHAISINPDMPQATYLLATALWKANRQEEAIVALQTSLALIPEYDMGWRLLADWQLERGETAKAEMSARKAFELNPLRVGTRYILGQSLMDEGKYEEALQLFEEVIELNRAPRWIYTLASQCYRQLGMTEKSEGALAKAGPPFVDWPDPMYKHIPNLIAGKAELAEYAMHRYMTNGPEQAKPFLIRAFKINPEHVNVRVALSIALQDAGQVDQAKKLLEELQGEPNTNYWKQYAGICIATQELDEAKQHIAKAFALDAKDANTHDIAALIANKQGDSTEACREWLEAGRLYIESENWKSAELSFAYANENCDLSLGSMQAFVRAQIELGHFDQARGIIQKLLNKESNNQETLALQSRLPKE